MKKFLLKTSLFLGLSATILFMLPLIRGFSVYTFRYGLNQDVRTLFIGDSRFANGVDDSMIPHSLNVSADADNYLTAYLRIKFILENQNSVKTIFIVFSPDIMGEEADSRLYAKYLMAGKIPQYFPLFSYEEWFRYISFDAAELLHNIAGRPFRILVNAFSQEAFCSQLGGYRISTSKKLQESITLVRDRLKKAPAVPSDQPQRYGNKVSKIYLEKIRAYCNERGIRLIGIAVPHYLANEVFDLNSYRETLSKNYSDLEVWDYLEMKFPDDCWQDINHLNRWGAEIFSRELAERMKREGIVSEEAPDGVPAAGTPRAGQDAAIARRSGKETRFS